MKHLKLVVPMLFVIALVITSGATMAQTLIVQPTPDRSQGEPSAEPTRNTQFQVQPTATTPPQRSAGDLVVVTDAPPVFVPAEPECSDHDGDGTTDDCFCASNDGECLVKLVANCKASNGDELDPGPENTACWKGDGTPVPPSNNNGATFQRDINDLAISTPGPGVFVPLNCTDSDGDGDTDACWCESNNGECLVDLVAWCQGDGDELIGGTETTTCWARGNHNN